MKITWDKKAEAVYIYLTDEGERVSNTTKISDYVNLDFAYVDKPIGIEILGVECVPIIKEV